MSTAGRRVYALRSCRAVSLQRFVNPRDAVGLRSLVHGRLGSAGARRRRSTPSARSSSSSPPTPTRSSRRSATRSSPGSRRPSRGRWRSASTTSTRPRASICRCWTRGSPTRSAAGSTARARTRYNWIGRLMAWVVEPGHADPRQGAEGVSARRWAGRATTSWRRSAPTRCSTSIACARPTASTSRGRACRSPAARWIRMPLGSGFAMMIAHERRHLRQARRVIEKCPFVMVRDAGLQTRLTAATM